MPPLISVDDLAQNIEREPARVAETARHHTAIIGALNNSHTDGEQDALTVFEALALTLAQLTANMADDEVNGLMVYVSERAKHHRPAFAESGKAARYYTEGLN